VIPTGSVALDVALGIGGLPRGRVVEIYGPESSGKTTVALHAVANAQKAGGIAAFIDAEHALDPEYAKKLGVDTDALLVSQPDTGEQALEIMDMLIRSGALDIVVVDSVRSGPESSGKTTVALHAVANAQKAGGIAAFIDAEHALDPEYAKKLGVDTDALLVSQPDTGEQALEIMDMLIRSGALDIVVVDSV